MARPWTHDEIQKALHLYATGLTWQAVGNYLGRSKSSCLSAASRHLTRKPEERDRCSSGPAIGLTMECERLRLDAKLGSMVLREACLDLFQRTANSHHISMDDAMACHLGYHSKAVIPGTERIYRGQAAERLAA